MFDELVKYTNNIVLSLIPVESACECYPHLSAKPVPTPVSFAKDFCGQASNFKEETNCKLFLRVLGTYLLILSYIADDWRLMTHDS